MTITIELLPEETERLTEEARQHGLSLEELVHGRLVPGLRPRKRNITDLEGLGKEIWQGVDVREYLAELRGERDQQVMGGGNKE